ncbi:helix-turn-helix domain-containing protein [Pseudonocardia xishanensis]|uniref:TetR/AcrR family transcriptional regulator n=1 Tax=Pseudonocardia xishanensis TaxID=630995 RepID=A0ABP8RSE8_9PSEU
MTAARAARRTARRRLPERGAQLADSAAELFSRRGYHGVSLADVATAVGVTAPAVYRHHRGKEALLAAALHRGLDVAVEAVGPAGDLEERLDRLAGAALERREVWVLLHRELRFLSPEPREGVYRRFDDLVSALDASVAADRPSLRRADRRLLVAAALAALSAPSLLRAPLPKADYRAELAAAALSVCRAELETARPVAPRVPPRSARNRGEQLLGVAIELFHERGFNAVSLDDIGAAVGIAGPSIYHHFSTKAELLVAAFSRAADRLVAGPGDAGEPISALERRVADYVDLGIDNRALFGVYVTEAIHLPPEAGGRIRATLRTDFGDWVTALEPCRPDLTKAQCTVRVGAARSIVNDLVRLGGFHTRTAIADEIRQLASAVLFTGPTGVAARASR